MLPTGFRVTRRLYFSHPLLGLLSACVGIIFVSYLPQLPSLFLLSCCLMIGGLCLCFRPLGVLGMLLLGIVWAGAYGHWLLSHTLASELEGRELVVKGRITGLPSSNDHRQRFVLSVDSVSDPALDEAIDLASFPRYIQLAWYGYHGELSAKQHWQLRVRLKRVRGFANPGGFDYQVWQLRRGITATGYIRAGQENRLLHASPSWGLTKLRARLQQWLQEALPNNPQRGLLMALLIGERSEISAEQWSVLQRTGTNHLIAISGLHIGLVALLGHWLGAGLGRFINLRCHRLHAPLLASCLSLVAAFMYSALADFSLPTQRALIMVLVLQLALLARVPQRALSGFVYALFAVLLFDPLAAQDMGFWLSFAAVACLLLALSGRLRAGVSQPWQKRQQAFKQSLKAQWVVFIGLLVPLMALIQVSSLLGPVANIVAIPLIAFLVVPLLLLAALMLTVSETLAQFFLHGAELCLSLGWQGLLWLDHLAGEWGLTLWSPSAELTAGVLLLAGFACLLLLLPRGLPGRWLGSLGLLLLVFPRPTEQSNLRVTVLDVGQGLAVVVEAAGRVLLYDTGPRYSERFDAGSGIILPFLRQRGIGKIDRLIVSHGDNDHAGGLDGLSVNIAIDDNLFGEADIESTKMVSNSSSTALCEGGMRWQWGEVQFDILSPTTGARAELDAKTELGAKTQPNNSSCVLLIRYAGRVILLPGDIELSVERELLRKKLIPEEIDLLVAPHHGSITSSSSAFVQKARPRYVVYSAGYRSRYGHPHPKVQARYQRIKAEELNTASDGALMFSGWASDRLRVDRYRQQKKRYWFDSSEL